MPNVTLIIPFRNEEAFLNMTLDTLAAQDLGGYSAEILLINGMSNDRSRFIAEDFVERSTSKVKFKVFDNPKLKIPYAFNLGIELASAPVISFGGAHTLYPAHYLRRAVDLLQTIEAGVIGGGHDQIMSSTPGVISEAISYLYLSPIGAGVAPYHRLKLSGYVDTVYGGFYRRQVFDTVGKFNELLARNQDNELNARVTAAGYKVYYHPDLDTSYVQKTSLNAFLTRAWSFGNYHPTTWYINPKSFRLRHSIPFFWVLYLLFLLGLCFLLPTSIWIYLPLMIYFLFLVISSIQLIMTGKSVFASLITIPLFSIYHFLYGLGTLFGFSAIPSHSSLKKK